MATHFGFPQNMGTFLLLAFSYFLPLFYHFTAFLFRLKRGDGPLQKKIDPSETEHTEEFNGDLELMDYMNEDEEKAADFNFNFRFPTYEDCIKCMGKCDFLDSVLVQETDFNGFIQKPEESDTKIVASDENLKLTGFEDSHEESDKTRFLERNRESYNAENKSQTDFDSSDEGLFVADSDSASIGFEHMHSYSDGFLSDEDFGGEFETDEFRFHQSEMPDENQHRYMVEFLSENDFLEAHGTQELDNEVMNTGKLEHQDLIEQLKTELRKVRTSSLPTILEESEFPEMEDLKPWKAEESFQHENCIGELRKFYRTYRERMRKFDILTYQKMYAIGFLQQKDPLQILSIQKSSSAVRLKTLLSQNVWLFKQKRHEIDPLERFIKELCSDLEAVYVGQMCLSWEFLHWQYWKALEIWDSDPRGIRRYNEVYGELQQFIVLMLRFMEDEPFQGTRIQHYIKCRCDFHRLLQVPLIREDSRKDKKKARKFERENSITSDKLVEILEECIRIFWQFVKVDKGSSGSQNRAHPEVQNAEDVELLREVTKILHKKQRKLKEIQRSQNNILRSFKICEKDEEDIENHVLYFFCQLDMKLISRVLNMSAIKRNQLVWCLNKLSRISFLHRKILVEPSFLLFPCSY